MRPRTELTATLLAITALTLANAAFAVLGAQRFEVAISGTAMVGAALAVLVCAVALWRFNRCLLGPLEQMAAQSRRFVGESRKDRAAPAGELCAIDRCLRALMAEVSQTRSTLDRSWKALLEAEKLASVGKLAAGMAHEIRNPLAAITMWLFVVRKAVGPNVELGRKFDIISEEVTRLENMVRSFLDFSRTPTPSLQSQHLSVLIQKTLDLAQHQIHQKRILVTCEAAKDLPTVVADPHQLEQVFLNLLNNALEVLPEGGEIHFEASPQWSAEGGRCVVVRVRDSGPGVPAAAEPRIFEPFFTTKENGTGLGLYLAAQIMSRLGGKLTLESGLPGRTTFAASIPIPDSASS